MLFFRGLYGILDFDFYLSGFVGIIGAPVVRGLEGRGG